jgi:yecA family protein
VIPGSANTTLDYDRLRDSLADAGTVVALAELHGGVCGALCAGGAAAAQRWLVDCLEDQESDATQIAAIARDLDDLVAVSWHGLSEHELKFAPLLPSEDAPLEEQVQALALWCHGFLGGLGASAPGVAKQHDDDGSVPEILRDFAEISRAALSEDEAAGRDHPDFALAEIQEYVRVSVQIVFEELGDRRAAAARESH